MKPRMKLTFDHPGDKCRLVFPAEEFAGLERALADAEMHGAATITYLEEKTVDSELFVTMFRKLSDIYRARRETLGFFLPEEIFLRQIEVAKAENQPVGGPVLECFGVRLYPIRDLSGVMFLTATDNWPHLIDAVGVVIVRRVR